MQLLNRQKTLSIVQIALRLPSKQQQQQQPHRHVCVVGLLIDTTLSLPNGVEPVNKTITELQPSTAVILV